MPLLSDGVTIQSRLKTPPSAFKKMFKVRIITILSYSIFLLHLFSLYYYYIFLIYYTTVFSVVIVCVEVYVVDKVRGCWML